MSVLVVNNSTVKMSELLTASTCPRLVLNELNVAFSEEIDVETLLTAVDVTELILTNWVKIKFIDEFIDDVWI